jgi:hypothetical protein
MDFAHRAFRHLHHTTKNTPAECPVILLAGYTAEIVSDAAAFAEHAGRAGKLEVSDVELAVRTRSAWEFEEAAPKDVSALQVGEFPCHHMMLMCKNFGQLVNHSTSYPSPNNSTHNHSQSSQRRSLTSDYHPENTCWAMQTSDSCPTSHLIEL